MKKLLLIVIVLSLSSCSMVSPTGMFLRSGGDGGCNNISQYNRETAESYYNTFGTYQAKISDKEATKLFECNYEWGDRVYVYSTFWGKKYILVRSGKAVTYVDEK